MTENNGHSPDGQAVNGAALNGDAVNGAEVNGEAVSGQVPPEGVGERVTPARDLRPAGTGMTGRGPASFMGGMSTEKPLNFSGSSKRLLRMLAPQRALMVTALIMGALSVTFSVIGPKVLGNVTNLIFDGYLSSKIPAGVTKAEFVRHLRATGHTTQAKLVGALNLTPGHGINFDSVGRTLLVVAFVYIASAVCSAIQGRVVAKMVQRAVFKLRQQVE